MGWLRRYSSTCPPTLQPKFFRLYNDGHIPASWRRTLFTMLAKHRKAALVMDFQPIASVRLFYKFFAYMILHRIQPCLDSCQPEEQHGFRAGRRLEEHLLTANLFFDKTLAANIPVWVLSLNLSNAFDRVDFFFSSRLGCPVVSLIRTRSVKSHVMDSSEVTFWSPWGGHWTRREQPFFSNQCRRVTRMRA